MAEARALALRNLGEISDEEDARLTEAAIADPDNPPIDQRPLRRRGRPPLARTKLAVKLRLDHDVVDHFRMQGAGWQTRINDALRKAARLK